MGEHHDDWPFGDFFGGGIRTAVLVVPLARG